jgi:hypothetical protein
MNRTDIINLIIHKFNYRKYLEIGVRNPNDNFLQIDVEYKVGVDPAVNHELVYKGLSQDFFLDYPTNEFDLIFIDGSHTHEDSMQDLFSSVPRAQCIVMHDCLPEKIEHTGPVKPKKGPWCGDVWKTWSMTCQGFDYAACVDVDHGVGVIFPDGQDIYMRPVFWDVWEANKKYMANIVSEQEFLKWIQQVLS